MPVRTSVGDRGAKAAWTQPSIGSVKGVPWALKSTSPVQTGKLKRPSRTSAKYLAVEALHELFPRRHKQLVRLINKRELLQANITTSKASMAESISPWVSGPQILIRGR